MELNEPFEPFGYVLRYTNVTRFHLADVLLTTRETPRQFAARPTQYGAAFC